jgi:hypothetical protein
VVDAIDLVLREQPEELPIELLRGRKISAERLFDDETAPGAIVLAGEARSAEVMADRRECRWGCCEIEQPVSLRVAYALDARELGTQPVVGRRIVGIAIDVVGASEQPTGDLLVDPAECKLTQSLRQPRTEGLIGQRTARDPDDCEGLRQ